MVVLKVFDMRAATLNLNRGTNQNFLNGTLLETLLKFYIKNIFAVIQRKHPMDLNTNQNVFRDGDIETICDIQMASFNLKLHRKYFMNRETQMNFVN